jgi:hypothetical protein
MAYTTIDKSTDYFNTVLYTGNATDDTGITGVGFQPNWVWLKDRTNGNHHRIYDSVRGATKVIYSSLTNAEGTASTGLKSFDSDGFTVGTGSDENGNGASFVSWNWLAGVDAGSSNTDGSITSTVSANTTSGFSIVSYTGTGSNATVGHGLGSAPKVVIIKDRSVDRDWIVGHTAIGFNKYVLLNSTSASVTASNRFQDTAPSSSVVTIGTHGYVNNSGSNYIAYCFAEKQGYSKVGSYIGNGSTDGTFVYTGFKPAWVMSKRTDSTNSWRIFDNKRPGFNSSSFNFVHANLANAEDSGDVMDLNSNGFKVRTNSTDQNTGGSPYVFMAFAEAPFVSSSGVPATAR